VVFAWLKSKPVPAPTDLELELIESLEAVTECVEEHHMCSEAADEGRQILERAKDELGIVGAAASLDSNRRKTG
jgi:hypothetical protein